MINIRNMVSDLHRKPELREDYCTTLDFQNGQPYRTFTLSNFESLKEVQRLPKQMRWDMRVVGSILPFKTNNYVVNRLINWGAVPNDPMFILTFPQKKMLLPDHYQTISNLLQKGASSNEVKIAADRIRMELNPHPAGQIEYNVPMHEGERLGGMQHKYRETILFFPSQGQTCHAYCSFCFRWPQFVGMTDMKFATREAELLINYLRHHPEVTDVLFTGGDPLIMKTHILKGYIIPLLENKLPNLKTIRIGTKALSYWPHRFLTDDDSEELLDLFGYVSDSGKHVALMAHFNHPVELSTPEVRKAIRRLRKVGVQIRTQSPLMRHINDDPDVWAKMWRLQVQNGCVPYYMFLARDTGAQRYFEIPLARAWEIFQKAYRQVSGICRTVRGPVMSTTPGKIQILGIANAGEEDVFVLRFLQGRNSDWVARPFFATYNSEATWLDQLEPAMGEKEFFFEQELNEILDEDAVA